MLKLRNAEGQISILVLTVVLALLAVTYVIGMAAEVVVVQQRLNAKAESIALAGALELEFNQSQACNIAREFGLTNFNLDVECESQNMSLRVSLSEPNRNPFLSVIYPKIHATSRAGIASGVQLDSVD